MYYERRLYRGHRWWTQPELTAADETVYALGPAFPIADLVAGNVPDAPAAMEWHHSRDRQANRDGGSVMRRAVF